MEKIDYPTYIEVPEDYWVCSHNVEWVIIDEEQDIS